MSTGKTYKFRCRIRIDEITTAGVAIAGVSAAAAYLDAKYHIRKDLADIRERRKGQKIAQKLGR